jgi:hypothetical protein
MWCAPRKFRWVERLGQVVDVGFNVSAVHVRRIIIGSLCTAIVARVGSIVAEQCLSQQGIVIVRIVQPACQ